MQGGALRSFGRGRYIETVRLCFILHRSKFRSSLYKGSRVQGSALRSFVHGQHTKAVRQCSDYNRVKIRSSLFKGSLARRWLAGAGRRPARHRTHTAHQNCSPVFRIHRSKVLIDLLQKVTGAGRRPAKLWTRTVHRNCPPVLRLHRIKV